MNSPCILAILDGWGHGIASPHNAIHTAKTPCYDNLIKKQSLSLLEASGEAVGLPPGQMGNSEVGHLHIGAGRLVRQSLLAIDHAMASGELEQHALINQLSATQPLHLLGLLSDGGVHSHEDHLFELINILAKKGHKQLKIHAILDGRDTAPQSATTSIEKLEKLLREKQCGHIVSVCGRFYAMDRDQRWERTEAAFKLYTQNQFAPTAASAYDAVKEAYHQNITDEFIPPTRIQTHNPLSIEPEHGLLFFNFRADRMRQMAAALTQDTFKGFSRENFKPIQSAICMTEYQRDLNLAVLFPKPAIQDTLGEVISHHQLRQHRVAETEKFAHVTYFLNGGQETAFDGEKRILLPSDKIATYDLKPKMQAQGITTAVIDLIDQGRSDVIIVNYANPDMVGHTGNFSATVEAIECIDSMLSQLVDAVETHHGSLFITADHGNAETMFNPSKNQQHTAHTCNPVPFIGVGKALELKPKGTLCDIAPTLLDRLGLPIPQSMSGRSLLQ